jgi:hypothetical protein
MATQFIIPQSVKIQNHLKITISLEKDRYDNFDVEVTNFGMEIPAAFVSLFSIREKEGISIGSSSISYGNINRRIYGSNIKSFLDSFEQYCSTNITNISNKGSKIEYYFVINEIISGDFDYSEYIQDELTVQFDDEQIKFYVDGKNIPDVFTQIQSGFDTKGIKFSKDSNSRIFEYSINKEYFNIKALVQYIISYFGANGYKIVNIEEDQYCIDFRDDGSKAEIIKIGDFVDFVGKIQFADKPEATIGDLNSIMLGGVESMLDIDTPIIDVESVKVS